MDNPILDATQISKKLIAYLRDELKNPGISYVQDLKQLQGGYETAIYRFQLKGVSAEYSHPLVLRLYPEFYGTQNASWESTIQNVLASAAYPVARAHFLCTDMSILGGAFFIMDYIPGRPLMFTSQEMVPVILGKTHAELHKINPAGLIKALDEVGIDVKVCSLDSRFIGLKNKAEKLPWAREGINWLLENRPPEPKKLSVCHGDFHPLNILADGGVVTGVLDWAGFSIADPVFDVANTIVLNTIPAKYLSESWDGFPSVDWDLAAELYLSEYQRHKELDQTHLDYYRVRRCVLALIEGVEGQKVWQHPLIVRDLIHDIQKMTGVLIKLPV